jgi:ribosomal protein S18 acetylase RimI-like enzyme
VDALQTRPMTADEYREFRAALVVSYAASHVEAGDWSPAEAEGRAADDIDALLPGGPATPGHLVLTALAPDGQVAGHLWIKLDQTPHNRGAWLYDIVVRAQVRGQGYGRALLAAAERETARHGGTSLGLNVFGGNAVARHLYESAGYQTTSLQMRKILGEAG